MELNTDLALHGAIAVAHTGREARRKVHGHVRVDGLADAARLETEAGLARHEGAQRGLAVHAVGRRAHDELGVLQPYGIRRARLWARDFETRYREASAPDRLVEEDNRDGPATCGASVHGTL